MSAFDDLMTFQRETEALGQVAGRLGWDQETMMPEGATPQRAEEHGAMANILHARRIDPRVGEWLETAEAADEVGAANLRHIRRDYDRTVKVPAALAAELADDLICGGVDHLHFYTLNSPQLTQDVCRAIGLAPRPRLQNVA